MGLGLPELLIILVIVFLIFGAGKLPEVMAKLGEGVTAFREGAAADARTELGPQPQAAATKPQPGVRKAKANPKASAKVTAKAKPNASKKSKKA